MKTMQKKSWVLTAAVVIAAGSVLALSPDIIKAILKAAMHIYKEWLPFEVRRYVWIAKQIVLSPWPYLFIPLAFVLEKIIPARRNGKEFGPSLAQDFIWFQTDTFFQMALLPVFIGALEAFYNQYLSFLTVTSIASWHPAAQGLLAFLVFDFSQWLHHFVRHKVIYFWYFHAIHHSQKYMNMFTDLRIHPLEYVIARTLVFIPLFMLQADPFTIVGVGLFVSWYTRLYHANLKTNYGPLKYVLVTPQSHRVHHSHELRHRDKNFGVVLTIWDRFFGTLYPVYDEYPETGIEDKSFPSERKLGFSLFINYGRQLLYPFRCIARDLTAGYRLKKEIARELSVSGERPR